ncbi:MAG: hypothetical protein GXO83_05560 [Chlorobi bacterium]|nr:hypothetical protein [Chlorobiota bacterium]
MFIIQKYCLKKRVFLFVLPIIILTGCKQEEILVTPTSAKGTLFDQRDSVFYTTVFINGRWWMSENLNYGKVIDSKTGGDNGDGLPSDNGIPEKYCYGDKLQNCDVYGGLYTWDEMMNYSTTERDTGICPAGWRVPSKPDWESLITAYPSSMELLPDGVSGFKGLLGGNKYDVLYGNLNALGAYWSSTGNQSSYAYYLLLNNSTRRPIIQQELKVRAFSVRCIKDSIP